jgi:hypothetical protein
MPREVHHHHGDTAGGGGGAGWVVALLVVVVLGVILWFVFAGGTRTTETRQVDVDVNLPTVETPAPPGNGGT